MGDTKNTETGNLGNFEILAQTTTGILINSGTGYDGYGNRLCLNKRYFWTIESSDWATIATDYAYVCVRRCADPILIDYQLHPVTNLPLPTKKEYRVEFYLQESVSTVNFPNDIVRKYPLLDENGIIGGLVLGKIFEDIEAPIYPPNKAPIMEPFKSPFLTVKDGEYFPLAGFNQG